MSTGGTVGGGGMGIVARGWCMRLDSEDRPLLGRRLEWLRKSRVRMSRAAVGRAVGVAAQTVYRWEVGWNVPPERALLWYASEFGVSRDWLVSGKGGVEPPEGVRSGVPERSGRIAVPRLVRVAVTRREIEHAEATHPVLEHQAVEGGYVLEVAGEAMHPTLCDGDLVLVVYGPYRPEQVEGRIVAVVLDGAGVLRRLRVERRGGRRVVKLVGDNAAAVPPAEVPDPSRLRIVGLVTTLVEREV